MNTKPVCIASAAASFIAACALEGDGLTIGQAVAVLVPAMMLLVWSFCQTDWYDTGKAEEYARGLKDTIDDLRFSLNEQEDINVLVINEDYYSRWEAPGYYDHNEVK